jgi:hypothetical protein
MAAVDTGKSFANGEQLTAAKLNQMFGNSTFAAGAVDNSTMTVNSIGQLAVNQITTTNIPANAVQASDLAQVQENQFLGRTATGTGDVSAIDLSTIATLLRPKYVLATDGTAQSGGSAGGAGPDSLDRIIQAATATDEVFTYNMSDFTATGQTGFNYNQIVGIVVQLTVESNTLSNAISMKAGGLTGNNAWLRFDNDSDDAGATDSSAKIREIVTCPVNAGQSTFVITHDRNPTSTKITRHRILGFMIMENLPSL